MTLEFMPNLGSMVSGSDQTGSVADMGTRDNRLRVATGQAGSGAPEATGQQRARNEAGWKQYLADPRVKSGLMQFGANLLAGQGFGVAAGGGVAAVGRAENARIDAEDAARVADLEERALALRESSASASSRGGGGSGGRSSGSGGVSGIGSNIDWLEAVTAEYQAAVDNDLTGDTTMPPVEQLIREAEARKSNFIYGQENPEYAAALTEFPNLTIAQFEAARAENAAANGVDPGATTTGEPAADAPASEDTAPIAVPAEVSNVVSPETQNAIGSLAAASALDTTLPLTEQSAQVSEALRSIETLTTPQAEVVRSRLRTQLTDLRARITQEAQLREEALAFDNQSVGDIQRGQEAASREQQLQLSRDLEGLALDIAVASSTGDGAEVTRLTQEFQARKQELDNITGSIKNSAIQPLLNTINENRN